MRIIAGEARGRRLRTPSGCQVRPTADRVREALFSMLHSRPPDGGLAAARVLDLFAGTGALALEALSRGAPAAVLVEADREAAQTARENIDHCGFAGRARLVVADAAAFLRRPPEGAPYGLVFIDPPYASGAAERTLVDLPACLLAPGAWVILEHSARHQPLPEAGALVCTGTRTYGATALSFYRRSGSAAATDLAMNS